MPAPPYDDLDALTTEKDLAAYVIQSRAALRDSWTPATGGRPWGQRHAELIDAVLRRLTALAAERVGGFPTGVALIAMGGYGARILAPHSDVDLTFVVDRDDDPPLLREAFRLVMDVLLSGAKIKIGYGYRHLSDLAQGGLDHQTQTALLDARLIAGDGALFSRFDREFTQSLQLADFLFQKESERQKVRLRAGVTPFSVEPDLKEGAGGLRDVQTALWMARARFDKRGDALWRELVRRKILTRDEARTLQDCREHLYRLRHLLHLFSGDRRDLFTIPLQEAAAERLEYERVGDSPAVEGFMRDHFTAAGEVSRLSEKIVRRIMDAPIRLDGGLSSLRRNIVVTEPEQAASDPLWPMRALELCQKYELSLSSPAAEAVEEHVASEDWKTLPSERVGARFVELLDQPGDNLATVRRMHATGLLKSVLPELESCMALVPYDPTHAYTVGEHSLRVLGNLIDAREGRQGTPLYKETIELLDSQSTLFLSALLHDIGKQWPRDRASERAPHEITGAEAIPEICARLGCSGRQGERVTALVRWHLLLAEVSRLRDLTRTEPIREVVERLNDLDLLRMMFVHTWADTHAVAPGVWSEMKARQLDELFERAAGALEAPGALGTQRGAEDEARRLDTLRERLRRRLTQSDGDTAPLDEPAVAAHTNAMPAAYLFNTPPETISLHVAMIQALESGGDVFVSDFRPLPALGQTELTLVTHDEPGLLARLTGVLHAYDIPLHAAQVFTRPLPEGGGIAIDTLLVDFRGRPLDRHQRGEVGSAIRKVLSGEETVAELIARRRRPEPTLPAVRSLSLDAELPDGDEALLDITTAPADGNVHALATLLTRLGWNIHGARLTTWAGGSRCAVYLAHGQSGVGDEATRQSLWNALRRNS